jgi:hypothetical protein
MPASAGRREDQAALVISNCKKKQMRYVTRQFRGSAYGIEADNQAQKRGNILHGSKQLHG